MIKTTKHIILFGLAFVLFCGCGQKRKLPLPSLRESYAKEDTKPFGGYIAYNVFKQWFENRYVETNEKPFDQAWMDMKEYSTEDRHTLYVLITKDLELNEKESDAMVSFVKQGNDLFIAADYIDPKLQDKMECETVRNQEIIKELAGKLHDASLSLLAQRYSQSFVFRYYYFPFLNYFSGYDSASTRLLGVNENGKPNYVILYLGKGRLYLHAAPRAFSNYFLLSNDNYQYLQQVLSYLRFEPNNIFWDEHYKKIALGRSDQAQDNVSEHNSPFSSLDVIERNPPLLWAFWLAILAILFFILFNIKRKQRVIEEIKLNVNTTVNFTETVGRLYLEKKNNKNISDKMITYFYEHIRNKYFLNTAQLNSEFIGSLARKSGVSQEDTHKLFNSIEQIQGRRNVTDMELLKLNDLIQNFYKK